MGFLNKIVLTILLSQLRAHNQTFDAFVSKTIAQICPFQRSCPRDRQDRNVSDIIRSCCQQCTCDKTCKIRGACCLEQQQAKLTDASNENAACHTALFSRLRFEPEYRYLVVDKCSNDYKKRSIIRKCHMSLPKTFDQAQIVSDSQGKIFKNSYCAVCNRVETFNRWLIRIDCKYGVDEQTHDTEIGYWLENKCRVWFEEPKEQTFLALRCYKPGFNLCNLTNRWTTYDHYIDDACRTMQTGRYVTQHFVYKNVFCYLCNPHTHTEQRCVEHSPVSKMGIFSFSAILNFTVNSKTGDNFGITVSHCSGSEVYDYFQGVCRELKCPFLNAPSNGQCVPLLSDLVGYGLEIATKLKISSPLNLTTFQRHGLMEDVVDRMKEQVDHKNVNSCQICEYFSVSDPSMLNESCIYIFIHIKTTQECQFIEIGKLADNLRSLELNGSSNGSNYQFLTQVIEKASTDFRFNTYRPELVMFTDQIHLCYGSWVLYKKRCPHVRLNGADYMRALKKGHINSDKHGLTFEQLSTYKPKVLEEATFDVCVEEYTGLDKSLAALNCFQKKTNNCVIIPYIYLFVRFFKIC